VQTNREPFVSETNKKIVIESYDLALNTRDADAAAEYLAEDYIQHNPLVADGVEGWMAMVHFMKTRYPEGTVDIKRVLADGDFVVLHVHSIPTPGQPGDAIVEIFRLQDGKIAEHWDVIQPIPEHPANANTMF
jgi:predicted SnoaL-like aldol condensation-catalyzing enzyme